jgi:hypothetical protein
MNKVAGSHLSWSKRLVCAFGAVAGAVLGVLVAAFFLSALDFTTASGSGWWTAGILLLVFVALVRTVYRQFCNREHKASLLLLYLAPLVSLLIVIWWEMAILPSGSLDITVTATAPEEPAAVELPLPDPIPLSEMPHFPWPPPKASGMAVLPTELLHGQATLGDVADALALALTLLSRYELRFYAVPNGFAMVTRLEAIDENGNKLASFRDRSQVDFITYIRNLFWVPPGYYRMVVFIVTDRLFEARGSPLDRKQADELLVGGFIDLPPSLGGRPYTTAYRTTALIYEFRKERQREVAQVVLPGRFAAHQHLGRIGWFDVPEEIMLTSGATVVFPAPIAAGGGER